MGSRKFYFVVRICFLLKIILKSKTTVFLVMIVAKETEVKYINIYYIYLYLYECRFSNWKTNNHYVFLLTELKHCKHIQTIKLYFYLIIILFVIYFSFVHHLTRGGRPATTISSPSHILLIFSSEPSRNPRPSNFIVFKCLILQDKTIF